MTARDSYLRRTYGITEEQYELILAYQGGICYVCGKPPKPGKNLHIDHDHKTGLIRGLLCHHCNFRVIGRQRNPEILRRAYEYLADPPAVRALGPDCRVPERRKTRRKKAA